MRVVANGPAWATLGAGIAVVVLVLAILLMAGVIPLNPIFVGGLIAALAVARLT